MFRTYQELWTALNEWDLGIVEDTFRIKQLFNKLTTFPFDKVSDVMTDYVRKLVRHALEFLFLAYTKEQSEALLNGLNKYPKDTDERKLIDETTKYIEAVYKMANNQLANPNAIVSQVTVTTYVDELVKRLYLIPTTQLWLVVPSFMKAYNVFNKVYGKHLKMDTVQDYLLKRCSDYVSYRSFEEQLVKDVTTLLGFNYPHPEVYFALKRLYSVLTMYYNEVERSKLFIDNVEWKMLKYFDRCLKELSSEEIERVSNPSTNTTIDNPTLTLEQRYDVWLQAIRNHQLDGSHVQEVLEGAAYFKAKPYDEVVHLPNFNEMVWYVNSLSLQKP